MAVATLVMVLIARLTYRLAPTNGIPVLALPALHNGLQVSLFRGDLLFLNHTPTIASWTNAVPKIFDPLHHLDWFVGWGLP